VQSSYIPSTLYMTADRQSSNKLEPVYGRTSWGLGSWPPGHASTPHSFTQNRCWTQLYKPHNM